MQNIGGGWFRRVAGLFNKTLIESNVNLPRLSLLAGLEGWPVYRVAGLERFYCKFLCLFMPFTNAPMFARYVDTLKKMFVRLCIVTNVHI